MFTTKKTKLFTPPAKNVASSPSTGGAMNAFLRAGLTKAVETRSTNGAKKLSSTLDPFVDQFSLLGSYKTPRSFTDISADAEKLWSSDRLTALQFIGYLRTIPRVVQFMDGETTSTIQKGAELKHEAIMRMIWLSQRSPDTFWKNVGLFVSLGSWHDIFVMLQYDLIYNGWEDRKLNWTKFGELIVAGLSSQHANLVKKYLPQIRARSDCKTVESQANTIIAKWICSLLFSHKDSSYNYKLYRMMKNSGNAHGWQQLISKQKYDELDFGKIHGRALNLLVKSKFLKAHGLSEKFSEWVKKPTTEVKYTGFVHELFMPFGRWVYSRNRQAINLLSVDENVRDMIDKQFATLVAKGGESKQSKMIVVRDTSGSMGKLATGTTSTCYDVAKALALYFSEFLTGPFANSFIEFNSSAKMHTWVGNTPCEKWCNDTTSVVGDTNFLSVVHLMASLKSEGIAESEFPTGILCISDGEFNPAQLGKTNVESARTVLRQAGFSEEYVTNFVIVLWNLQSYGIGNKFETTSDVPNVFYFSGYSASTIGFLTNKILSPRELFNAAMNQEVLNMLAV